MKRFIAGIAMLSIAGPAFAATPGQVIDHYADIAEAKYADALTTAKTLDEKINDLITSPGPATLQAAKDAGLAARVPYQQTEVYRFGNAVVDDWEGKVNAWPLDEGLIDYVDTGSYGAESFENDLYTANMIANAVIKVGGREVSIPEITPAVLENTLHEAGDIEANVATGYHAIEFLLWGQDLNGTGAGAGNRPATDFDPSNCTGGNCERRAQYLAAASALMLSDLEWMANAWKDDGDARKALEAKSETEALTTIFTGLGSLSYGELAGERMKLGLLLHDPEEEHDCFADNTHNSHFYDQIGMQNIYTGRYVRVDGSVMEGPSVSVLVRAKDAKADAQTLAALKATTAAMQAMVDRAEAGEAYDQMIGEGNAEGNAIVQAAIDGLIAQTREFERGIAVLQLNPIAFEGSDSLDNPSAVQE
ncbi:MAG: imelysin family protein [Pseudomonadota bacterium]